MSKADILRLPEYLGHIVEAIERIHRYIEDLDEVVWQTIHADLPELHEQVRQLVIPLD
jgi:uncharacterized protein with HEPN domain